MFEYVTEARQRDLNHRAERAAKRNRAHEAQPDTNPVFTHLEDLQREAQRLRAVRQAEARMNERASIEGNITALRDQLDYAKEQLALVKPFLQMWEGEVETGGVPGQPAREWQWRNWAKGQVERHREKLQYWERCIRSVTNDLRGKEAHLEWWLRRNKPQSKKERSERAAKVAQLHRTK